MSKIFILSFLIILASLIHSTAQFNVNFDDDCPRYNSAILTNAMIQALGPDTIMNFLDNESRCVIICRIDTFGQALEIVNSFTKINISDEHFRLIESYLTREKVCFYNCIINSPKITDQSVLVNELRCHYKENPDLFLIAVGFPGDLLFDYENDQEKKKNGSEKLSKYDYLLTQIKRYLPSEE